MSIHFVVVETNRGRRYVGIANIAMVQAAGKFATVILSNGESVDIQESAENFVARVEKGQTEPVPLTDELK
jgi:hypothetical protein